MGRHQDQPAPTFSWGGRSARRRQPALSRLAEHQPDAGRRDQRDENRGPPFAQGRLLQQPQLQAQNVQNTLWQGSVEFDNDSNNALDTQFGFSNAAVGVFRRYQQASKFVEGSMIYNNTEAYIQDNWKVNSRLTSTWRPLHAPAAAARPVPADVELLPGEWKPGSAPCSTSPAAAPAPCAPSGNARNAMNPLTTQILVLPGAANSAAAIGTPVPGSAIRSRASAGRATASRVRLHVADGRRRAALRCRLRHAGTSR